MASTHKVKTIVTIDGRAVSKEVTISSQGSVNIPELICPDNATTEIGFAAPLASIKDLLIYTDGPLTLRTNDGVTGDDEFVLDVDNYLAWNESNLAPNPITADITSLFAVVPLGDDRKIWIYALLDVTP